ncbi:MAG TPA: hypothetical protein VGM64_06900 [Lacunisphaera sp.]|jgi:hypothetical protein
MTKPPKRALKILEKEKGVAMFRRYLPLGHWHMQKRISGVAMRGGNETVESSVPEQSFQITVAGAGPK